MSNDAHEFYRKEQRRLNERSRAVSEDHMLKNRYKREEIKESAEVLQRVMNETEGVDNKVRFAVNRLLRAVNANG